MSNDNEPEVKDVERVEVVPAGDDEETVDSPESSKENETNQQSRNIDAPGSSRACGPKPRERGLFRGRRDGQSKKSCPTRRPRKGLPDVVAGRLVKETESANHLRVPAERAFASGLRSKPFAALRG